jgi:hypothetical protein
VYSVATLHGLALAMRYALPSGKRALAAGAFANAAVSTEI